SFHDITQQKLHAKEFERLNRMYAALSNVSQAIVRMPGRDDLFHEVCQILIERGGVRMAWIGWRNARTDALEPVAVCGAGYSDLRSLQVAAEAQPQLTGPSIRAFQEGRTYICEDMLADAATLSWLEHITAAGFRSCAMLPIRQGGTVSGVLSVYAEESNFFQEEEIALLMEASDDISFALDNVERKAERERLEMSANAERDKAQRYLDTAEVILLALDMQGHITMINRYACGIMGWSAEELIGRDFIEMCVPPRIQEETRARMANVHAGPDTSIVRNPIITRAGMERQVEWRNTLLRDSDGRVTSTLSSGVDLTDRAEAVEALLVAEERMRFALESAQVGIWDMNYRTGQLRWSPILEAQYGLKPGTFAGTHDAFVEHVHPDDRAKLFEIVGGATSSGEDFTTLHRALWSDGTIRWLSGAGRVHFGKDGEPERGIGISLDITDRHTLEAQFQQAQKMEAVGRLAGGVAHDFNNLLTVMLGFCELLLIDVTVTDRNREDIEEIQKAGLSAAALTRQLLAFSRKQIIEPALQDLSDVVAEMRPMLARLIGEDVKILLGLHPSLCQILADRAQVEQVIMNLAVNARDAMPTGGVLTIETSNVRLDEHYAKSHFSAVPGEYVLLTVSDTGSGMTPETQARLFEPFFTTKEIGRGTGLGLATVHGIVSRGGGSVSVYSEVGTGTSFRAYFPKAEAARAFKPNEVESRPFTGTQTLLVVEDAEGLRELTRRLLVRMGYTVLVAADAKEALRIFENTPEIDLVLTDVVMPGASGPELSKILQAKKPTLRVVFMSGYTDESIVHHGVLNPGVALLSKPFTFQALGRKIRETLDMAIPQK
ncbi:MAG: PAS domain S-box protein, partial [Phycisphaerae bacterium]|nr:PAS domain S-box protein [Gemmatimonadaceae bacterium]